MLYSKKKIIPSISMCKLVQEICVRADDCKGKFLCV